MIRVKIKPDDISTVAKVVLIDQKSRILFLKRSDYVEKFAGEWDLPGGHLKGSESLEAGLAREVKEETGLALTDTLFFLKLDNIHFFYAMYDSQEVVLSREHTDFKFFERQELDDDEKFQKVAMRALEVRHESIN